MLAKQFRLPSSLVLRDAQIIRSDFFTLRYQKNNLPHSRFGFVVSKKIDKRAVVRNRIKRLVRSAVEKKWTMLPGWDMLFVMKPSIALQTRENVVKTADQVMATMVNL